MDADTRKPRFMFKVTDRSTKVVVTIECDSVAELREKANGVLGAISFAIEGEAAHG